MFTSSAVILTVNLRSDWTSSLARAVLLPVRVAYGRPLRCSSSTRFLPSENIVPAKGLCSWHCIISKGLLKFSMCCGGIVTEFNIKRTAYISLRDVPCFHFHDKIHKHLLTWNAPTPHWGIAKPCHCKWGWRKDQGQRASVLAGCSIASTARRKLISLLYFRTSYMKPYSEWRNEVSFFDNLTTLHWTAENGRLSIKGSKLVRGELEKSEEVIEADSELLYWLSCLGTEQYEAKKRFFMCIVLMTFSSAKYFVVARTETIWKKWAYLLMLSLSLNNIQMRFECKETLASITTTLRVLIILATYNHEFIFVPVLLSLDIYSSSFTAS